MAARGQRLGGQLGAIEAVLVRIAAEVAGREAVVIGCRDGALGRRVRGLLRAAEVDLARVHLHAVPSANSWARDHGPITLVRSGWPLLLDFESEADDAISRHLAALRGPGSECQRRRRAPWTRLRLRSRSKAIGTV